LWRNILPENNIIEKLTLWGKFPPATSLVLKKYKKIVFKTVAENLFCS
jgi:hypothetical protein